MRPALKSGLLPVWRDRDTLQIGIDPRRAIALSGMAGVAFLIALLDGSRDRRQVIATAEAAGVPAAVSERVLTLLAAGGVLDDFPASTLREVPQPLRARLAAELATASLAHGDGDGGARLLARRRLRSVWIEGERRIGRAVGRILAAAGVGQVRIGAMPGMQARSRPAAARPAGPASRPADARPARAAIAGRPSLRPGRRPDLVIVVGPVGQDRSGWLTRNRLPHLAVSASEAIGTVGPLVIPGQSACLRCLDHVRAAADPAWPLILAQLAMRRPDPVACDAVLASAVAAQAAGQALIAIDKGPAASAAVNGTIELVLPDWRWRRRTWPIHPACLCACQVAR